MNTWIKWIFIVAFLLVIAIQFSRIHSSIDNQEEYLLRDSINNNLSKKWNSIMDSIFQLSLNNRLEAIRYTDLIVSRNNCFQQNKIELLIYLTSELFYLNEQPDSALKRQQLIEKANGYISPRDKILLAGCYTQKGDFKKAITLLNQATLENEEMQWFTGNFYEVINNREKAIQQYDSLYQINPSEYSSCLKRIEELSNPKTKLMKTFTFGDIRNRYRFLSWNYTKY